VAALIIVYKSFIDVNFLRTRAHVHFAIRLNELKKMGNRLPASSFFLHLASSIFFYYARLIKKNLYLYLYIFLCFVLIIFNNRASKASSAKKFWYAIILSNHVIGLSIFHRVCVGSQPLSVASRQHSPSTRREACRANAGTSLSPCSAC
jgi:hypothetical protein